MEQVLDYLFVDFPAVDMGRRILMVFANDNLEPYVHKYDDLLDDTANVDFLLVESSDLTLPIHSVILPQYGVYYQAGRLAGQWLENLSNVLIVSANPNEDALAEMSRGFSAGLKKSDESINVTDIFLSETSGGYDMADRAYRMSYEIDGKYDLVLPLCGGTCQGFYRYNRENPGRFRTVGVDSDMQHYSQDVPFSVLKYMDSVMQMWITRWGDGEDMPRTMSLGLKSGYTEVLVADKYAGDGITELANSFHEEAIKVEEEYENN